MQLQSSVLEPFVVGSSSDAEVVDGSRVGDTWFAVVQAAGTGPGVEVVGSACQKEVVDIGNLGGPRGPKQGDMS
jgi:hypothetical protein